ncbi:MAG: NAD(P)/FAD-dependent oxidoreductase [Flavisolibacter sp.]
MPVQQRKKLIVIGGGAAGFFCAVNAARMSSNLEVIIIEKTSKLLSKVKVSGGGRCNVTHACFNIDEMKKSYPRGENFVRKAFHQFFTTDTINWFNDRGVKLKTESDGRMFPISDSSLSIINCLIGEANKFNVQIRTNCEVKIIESVNHQNILHLGTGEIISSDFICVASGGYPKLSMFSWLSKLGHRISNPIPSLFTFNLSKHPITSLMGVSVERIKIKVADSKLKQEGPLLITHWGISGPSVLRLSAWGASELAEKSYEFTIHINWVPQFSEQQLKIKIGELRSNNSTRKIINSNFVLLPKRLWQFLLDQSGINSELRFAELSSKSENSLLKNLVDFTAEVKGKTTYKEEFVTAGGIITSEVDPNTMMSRKIENVFFAGEILDVDGITGGFNFQHAWTSGWIAAKSIAEKSIQPTYK